MSWWGKRSRKKPRLLSKVQLGFVCPRRYRHETFLRFDVNAWSLARLVVAVIWGGVVVDSPLAGYGWCRKCQGFSPLSEVGRPGYSNLQFAVNNRSRRWHDKHTFVSAVAAAPDDRKNVHGRTFFWGGTLQNMASRLIKIRLPFLFPFCLEMFKEKLCENVLVATPEKKRKKNWRGWKNEPPSPAGPVVIPHRLTCPKSQPLES